MSGWLVILTGLIYLFVAIEQYFVKNSLSFGIVYFGYALSNVGLYLALK